MISYGNQLAGKDDNDKTLIISSLTSLTMSSADITGAFNFGTILESKVCVSAANTSNDQSSTYEASMTKWQSGKTILTSQRKMVDAPTLAKRWNIPLDRAKTTIIATTQRGIRLVKNPSIMRRFPLSPKIVYLQLIRATTNHHHLKLAWQNDKQDGQS